MSHSQTKALIVYENIKLDKVLGKSLSFDPFLLKQLSQWFSLPMCLNLFIDQTDLINLTDV